MKTIVRSSFLKWKNQSFSMSVDKEKNNSKFHYYYDSLFKEVKKVENIHFLGNPTLPTSELYNYY